jgi:large subunit ribosomal protein L29
MDIDKVRQMTDAELVEELANQRRHLYDLRFQLATRQLTDHSQLAQTRRGIARILTVLTERELRPSEARPEPAPRTRAGRASKAAAPAESEPAAAAATAETGGNR